MSKSMMINCDEATSICDKNQYGEASFLEKMKLRFHLFMCKHCKKYVKHNKTMSIVFKNHAEICKKESACLSYKEKKVLKEELLEAVE